MRVQSPIAGGQRGSAGGLVFQHYHGRTYARSKPAIFHYGPTPGQAANQAKYYSIHRQFQTLYKNLRPYLYTRTKDDRNYYNELHRQIYAASCIFDTSRRDENFTKLGLDLYDRIRVFPGDYTLYYDNSTYYLTFYDFRFDSKVDFVPSMAHALLFCTYKNQFQYITTPFTDEHLTFPFSNSLNWFPDEWFDMYIALGNDEYLSNFWF